MRYLSVCSGIEAATVAWKPLGWSAVAFSEIEKFPSAALAHHYPEVRNLGDMTNYGTWKLDAVDVLVGGTPCQSFSVAGERAGLDDQRGHLAVIFLRIAQRFRPRWLLWENVPGILSHGRGRTFGTFLRLMAECGYGFAYRVLDAQYFGLAQRRERVFVVGYLGDWRPPAAVLFERASLSWHPAPSRKTREDVAGIVGGGSGSRGWCDDLDRCGAFVVNNDSRSAVYEMRSPPLRGGLRGAPVVAVFGGNNTQGELDTATACNSRHRFDFESETLVVGIQYAEQLGREKRQNGMGVADEGDPCYTLERRQIHGVKTPWICRRLTPLEYERLQGFPDNYTLIPYRNGLAKDGPRYKALGNSMPVPVMRWLGRRIEMADVITREACG